MLIVDDHPKVRDGVRALLATEPALRVVGEAATGDEALGLALVLRPDLIVLDHEMPGSRGLEVLPKLRVILPDAQVVMFTMAPGIARQARIRGAAAVVPKDDLDGLLATLRRVAAARPERALAGRPVRRAGWDWWSQRLIVPALAVAYVAAFPALVGLFGNQAIDIAILLVAAAGAAYGLRGGLIAGVLALVANTILIRAVGLSAPDAGGPLRVVIAIAIGAAFGQLRDVTRRANDQARSLADTGAALEASDSRLLSLVQDAPVLLVSIDTSGVITDALGAGFGDHPLFSAERMRGQQAAVFYADEPELLARLSRALSGEEFSERVQRSGFVYDIQFRPRHDPSGSLVGTTAVLVNLNSRS
ncbi:MAG TPA: response regulator transcription factor [Candidatus Saccharimonadales bacterium]|nr:response regulator transcription factor [Candidatus Saccharimonadales bacterium]